MDCYHPLINQKQKLNSALSITTTSLRSQPSLFPLWTKTYLWHRRMDLNTLFCFTPFIPSLFTILYLVLQNIMSGWVNTHISRLWVQVKCSIHFIIIPHYLSQSFHPTALQVFRTRWNRGQRRKAFEQVVSCDLWLCDCADDSKQL